MNIPEIQNPKYVFYHNSVSKNWWFFKGEVFIKCLKDLNKHKLLYLKHVHVKRITTCIFPTSHLWIMLSSFTNLVFKIQVICPIFFPKVWGHWSLESDKCVLKKSETWYLLPSISKMKLVNQYFEIKELLIVNGHAWVLANVSPN